MRALLILALVLQAGAFACPGPAASGTHGTAFGIVAETPCPDHADHRGRPLAPTALCCLMHCAPAPLWAAPLPRPGPTLSEALAIPADLPPATLASGPSPPPPRG